MTDQERIFLAELHRRPRGRIGYEPVDYDWAAEFAADLLANGLIKHRRFEGRLGFQITEAGRAWVGGAG